MFICATPDVDARGIACKAASRHGWPTCCGAVVLAADVTSITLRAAFFDATSLAALAVMILFSSRIGERKQKSLDMNGIAHLGGIQYNILWMLWVCHKRLCLVSRLAFLVHMMNVQSCALVLCAIVLDIHSAKNVLISFITSQNHETAKNRKDTPWNEQTTIDLTSQCVACGTSRLGDWHQLTAAALHLEGDCNLRLNQELAQSLPPGQWMWHQQH